MEPSDPDLVDRSNIVLIIERLYDFTRGTDKSEDRSVEDSGDTVSCLTSLFAIDSENIVDAYTDHSSGIFCPTAI